MKSLAITLSSLIFVGFSHAKSEKIDWKICEKEIKEFCTTVADDHEKHECLEEAPKAKVSKACSDYNKKMESKFKDKHEHSH